MKRRVVITGTGAVTSAGIGTENFWESIKSGKSGINKIERVDLSDMPSQVGGEIKNFDPSVYIDKKEIKRMDRFTHYAMAAAQMAVSEAGLDLEGINKERTGVLVGTGIGGIETFENQHKVLLEKGPDRVSPFFVPMMIPNMAAGQIAIRFGAKGFVECVTTACATSTNTIGDAFKVIQRGDADVIIAGGTEAPITRLTISGFYANKALTTNTDPVTACRPFDLERSGFIIGEGAGILILEELEHAKSRGARIIAEVVGYGCTNDAFHITAIPEGGDGGARCMKRAIDDAGISPESVGYINAHGTSTAINDRNETAAIKTTFGEHAYKLAVSSTKSMTGHLLGGAGAIEAIITAMSLKEGFLPPTINYKTPDPDCDLDCVPNTGRPLGMEYAMSNSFGFGGHNATLVLKAYK